MFDIAQCLTHLSCIVEGRALSEQSLPSNNLTSRNPVNGMVEGEDLFHELADAIPQLVWMANPDGEIFWYNKRWHEYTGTSHDDNKGWGWQSVHDPLFLPLVIEKWKQSLSTGEPFEMKFPLRRADGAFRLFLTRVLPVRGANGKITRWFGTNTDIDAAEEDLKEVQNSRDRLQKH